MVFFSFFSCPIIPSSVTLGTLLCHTVPLSILAPFSQCPVLRRSLSCRTGTSVSCSIGCVEQRSRVYDYMSILTWWQHSISSRFRDSIFFPTFFEASRSNIFVNYLSPFEKDLAYGEIRSTVPWNEIFTKRALYPLN